MTLVRDGDDRDITGRQRRLGPRPMRSGALLLLATAVLGSCGLLGGAPIPPLPPGTNDCIGLERAQCLQLLDDFASRKNVKPVAWRIRCLAVCGRERGDVEMTITWADGGTETATMGWAGAQAPPGVGLPQPADPVPTPEVPPTCFRVPEAACNEQWASSMTDLTPEQRAVVAAVLIECRTDCTLLNGDGQTTVVFRDGTRFLAADWSYRSGN